MKLLQSVAVFGCAFALLTGSALAADKADTQQTCCQKASAASQECKHKCCVAAHKDGKSCEKCNPNKEDLALLKKDTKKSDK